MDGKIRDTCMGYNRPRLIVLAKLMRHSVVRWLTKDATFWADLLHMEWKSKLNNNNNQLTLSCPSCCYVSFVCALAGDMSLLDCPSSLLFLRSMYMDSICI